MLAASKPGKDYATAAARYLPSSAMITAPSSNNPDWRDLLDDVWRPDYLRWVCIFTTIASWWIVNGLLSFRATRRSSNQWHRMRNDPECDIYTRNLNDYHGNRMSWVARTHWRLQRVHRSSFIQEVPILSWHSAAQQHFIHGVFFVICADFSPYHLPDCTILVFLAPRFQRHAGIRMMDISTAHVILVKYPISAHRRRQIWRYNVERIERAPCAVSLNF